MTRQLSVAICTYRRDDLLARGLAALASDLGARPVEVLVVDNACAGSTERLVTQWIDRLPGLRYEQEARTGLSHARNRALELTGADVVAFLDDDALVRPGWFDAMLRRAMEEDVVGVAGRIHLRFEQGTPSWLHPRIVPWFSALDLGDEDRDLTAEESPVGACMAVRAEAARAAGGFDVALGRSGASLISQEEVALFDQIRGRGRIAYAAGAEVDHLVGPERSSPWWVLRRAFADGRSRVLVTRDSGRDAGSSVWDVLAWSTYRRLPLSIKRIARADARRAQLVYELVRRAIFAGQVVETIRPRNLLRRA